MSFKMPMHPYVKQWWDNRHQVPQGEDSLPEMDLVTTLLNGEEEVGLFVLKSEGATPLWFDLFPAVEQTYGQIPQNMYRFTTECGGVGLSFSLPMGIRNSVVVWMEPHRQE